MKFFYVDESGQTDQSDVFVMCGVMVDATKLRLRTYVLDELIRKMLGRYPGRPRSELKTSQFINGRGAWGRISAVDRKDFLHEICKLAVADGGKVFGIGLSFDASDKALRRSTDFPAVNNDPWLLAAMFTMSLVQKKMQTLPRNKGHTVVVMDDNKRLMPAFSDAIYVANPWFDGLYQRMVTRRRKGGDVRVWKERRASDRFNQIINTPFPIKSEHSPIIQVADAVSYAYRRRLELLAADATEAWDGERQYYDRLASLLDGGRQRLGRCPPAAPCVEFYDSIRHPEWQL